LRLALAAATVRVAWPTVRDAVVVDHRVVG